jgi:hypothetical protein
MMTTTMRLVFLSACLLAYSAIGHATGYEDSTHVFVGYVYSVRNHEEDRAEGKDTVYTAKMIIKDVEKGSSFEPDNIVTFMFWKVKKRKDGYNGDMGQSEILKAHTQARVYVSKTDSGQLRLLNPMGWEKVSY